MELFWWLVIAALTIVPLMKLLPHFGIEKMWAFIALIPVGAAVLLWMMAMKLQEMEKR